MEFVQNYPYDYICVNSGILQDSVLSAERHARYLRLRDARAVSGISFLRPPAIFTPPLLCPKNVAVEDKAIESADILSSAGQQLEIMGSLREQVKYRPRIDQKDADDAYKYINTPAWDCFDLRFFL